MGRPRLLIVDDDSYTRIALRTLFTGQGWEVDLAATMAEGLAGLRHSPAALILDLNLPDGRGETILDAVRLTTPSTRVAVCSGSADGPRLDRVRKLGPELILWKPIDIAPIVRLFGVPRAVPA